MIRLSTLLILLLLPVFSLSSATETDIDNESFVIEAIIPGQSNGQSFSNLVVVDLTGGSSDTHTVVQNGDQFYIGRGEQLQSKMDLFEIHYVTNNPAGSTITVTLGEFTKAVWDENTKSYVVDDSTSSTTLDSTIEFGTLSWIGSGSNDLWLKSDLTDIKDHFSDNESGKRYQYPSRGYSLIVTEGGYDDRVYSLTFSAQYFTLSWTDVDGGYNKNLNCPAAAEDYPLNVEFVKRFSVSIAPGAVVDPGFYRMDVKIEVGSNL